MEKKFKITVEDTVYLVTVEDLGLTAGTTVSTPPVVAPVPAPVAPASVAANTPRVVTCRLGGVVESIEVTVGQTVNSGDKVMVIEAMKMKTPMYASCSGRIASIAVKVGEKVETGQALLAIG